MELPWLQDFAAQWSEATAAGREPHAVLLSGPPGVGKRAAAAWMVRRKLGLPADALPAWPFERPQHADLRWLERPEDRHAILIDQVRELVAGLALTSYEGRGKAAVIEPANAMNANSANALLKTLEEPPGSTLLVLVADRLGRLPATILSRCQRITLRVPPESEGLAWLDRLRPGMAWAEPLRMAGLAPIAAVTAAEHLDACNAMARDLAAVAGGDASPIDVAESWAKQEPGFVLEWLARQIESAARAAVAGPQAAVHGALPDSVLQRMDSRNLFCYLDRINRLRGQPGGSFNVQLAFEGLLIDWATGLRGPAMGHSHTGQARTYG